MRSTLLLALTASSLAFAADPEIKFEKYKLPNGLTVILSEDHRLPQVAVNIWYHVGAANQSPGRSGFAHLFEHMMFSGSKHVQPSPFKVLESIGTTAGAMANGTTNFDRTNYFEVVPSTELLEGLATFLATLDNPVVGVPLAAAIAIHNIPEGVSIAIPVYYATRSRRKAVLATVVSALAEPAGALIGYMVLAPFLTPSVFAVVFGMIAGVMVFLALDELLPTAKRYAKGHETVYGMVLGMGALAASLVLFK